MFFIKTLPRILCAGALSHVSFFDLFGLIAGATNPIAWHSPMADFVPQIHC